MNPPSGRLLAAGVNMLVTLPADTEAQVLRRAGDAGLASAVDALCGVLETSGLRRPPLARSERVRPPD